MIKSPKIYVGFLLIILIITIVSMIQLDAIVSSLGVTAIGLIGYQLRVNEDIRLVIVRNQIKRKFERKELQNYYVILLELTNLSTYRQYYDLNLSDNIIQETLRIVKKEFSNVFLYSQDQLLIVTEFQHKTIINQRLRTEEQEHASRRIISVLERHKFIQKKEQNYYHITCAIGTGSMGFRGDYNTISEMIKLAYFALLQAKKQGRSFLIATEDIRLIKEDIDIFNHDLEDGIKDDEIVPHFLPIVDTSTMRVIGCECLLRWEKNEYRIIEASKFKQVAEEKQLFEELDQIIIQKSFQSYASWRADELIDDDFLLTLNLTRNTIQRMHAQELFKLAERYGIPPQNIELDISEQDIKDNYTTHLLLSLKEFGFRVSIDAFLVDHTMLQSLIDIPVDTIKIDRSLLPTMSSDRHKMQFYKLIVKIAHMQGYQTMAKGVESKLQLHLARDMQVDYIQGYYITPPQNDIRIRGFLNKYHRSILA
jgi:EAL domain-containing protein (putative c-di-GMP-specific phosphodiesterase class I)/GGDEF domain-containing protein